MRRLIAVLVGLVLVATVACKEKPKQPDPRETQINLARARIAEAQANSEALQTSLNQVKTAQQDLAARLNEVQNALNTSKTTIADAQQSLDALARAELAQKQKQGAHWPWMIVKILIILFIIIIVYIVIKAITRSDGSDDEEDEGFTEESDLGTVRYPGAKSESTKPRE